MQLAHEMATDDLVAELAQHAEMARRALLTLPEAEGRVWWAAQPPAALVPSSEPVRVPRLFQATSDGRAAREQAFLDSDRSGAAPVVFQVEQPVGVREFGPFARHPGKQAAFPDGALFRPTQWERARDLASGREYVLVSLEQVQQETKAAWQEQYMLRAISVETTTGSRAVIGHSAFSVLDWSAWRWTFPLLPDLTNYVIRDKDGTRRPVNPPVATGFTDDEPPFVVFATHGRPATGQVFGPEGVTWVSGGLAGRLADTLAPATRQLLLVCYAASGGEAGVPPFAQNAANRRAGGSVTAATGTSGMMVRRSLRTEIYAESTPGGPDAAWLSFQRKALAPTAHERVGLPFGGRRSGRHQLFQTPAWRQTAEKHEAAIFDASVSSPELLTFAEELADELNRSGYSVVAPQGTRTLVTLMAAIDTAVHAARAERTDAPAERTYTLAEDGQEQAEFLAQRGVLVGRGEFRSMAPLFDAYREVVLKRPDHETLDDRKLLLAAIALGRSTGRTLAAVLHDYSRTVADDNRGIAFDGLRDALLGDAVDIYDWVRRNLVPIAGAWDDLFAQYGEAWLPPHHQMYHPGLTIRTTGDLTVPEGLVLAIGEMTGQLPPVTPDLADEVGAGTWAERRTAVDAWGREHSASPLDRLMPAHLTALFLATHQPDHDLLTRAEAHAQLPRVVEDLVDRGSADFPYLLADDAPFLQWSADPALRNPNDPRHGQARERLIRRAAELAPTVRSWIPLHAGMLAEALGKLPHLPAGEPVYVGVYWPSGDPATAAVPQRLVIPAFQLALRTPQDALATVPPVAGYQRVVVEVQASAARDVSFASGRPGLRQAMFPWDTEVLVTSHLRAQDARHEPFEWIVAADPTADTRSAASAPVAGPVAGRVEVAPWSPRVAGRRPRGGKAAVAPRWPVSVQTQVPWSAPGKGKGKSAVAWFEPEAAWEPAMGTDRIWWWQYPPEPELDDVGAGKLLAELNKELARNHLPLNPFTTGDLQRGYPYLRARQGLKNATLNLLAQQIVLDLVQDPSSEILVRPVTADETRPAGRRLRGGAPAAQHSATAGQSAQQDTASPASQPGPSSLPSAVAGQPQQARPLFPSLYFGDEDNRTTWLETAGEYERALGRVMVENPVWRLAAQATLARLAQKVEELVGPGKHAPVFIPPQDQGGAASPQAALDALLDQTAGKTPSLSSVMAAVARGAEFYAARHGLPGPAPVDPALTERLVELGYPITAEHADEKAARIGKVETLLRVHRDIGVVPFGKHPRSGYSETLAFRNAVLGWTLAQAAHAPVLGQLLGAAQRVGVVDVDDARPPQWMEPDLRTADAVEADASQLYGLVPFLLDPLGQIPAGPLADDATLADVLSRPPHQARYEEWAEDLLSPGGQQGTGIEGLADDLAGAGVFMSPSGRSDAAWRRRAAGLRWMRSHRGQITPVVSGTTALFLLGGADAALMGSDVVAGGREGLREAIRSQLEGLEQGLGHGMPPASLPLVLLREKAVQKFVHQPWRWTAENARAVADAVATDALVAELAQHAEMARRAVIAGLPETEAPVFWGGQEPGVSLRPADTGGKQEAGGSLELPALFQATTDSASAVRAAFRAAARSGGHPVVHRIERPVGAYEFAPFARDPRDQVVFPDASQYSEVTREIVLDMAAGGGYVLVTWEPAEPERTPVWQRQLITREIRTAGGVLYGEAVDSGPDWLEWRSTYRVLPDVTEYFIRAEDQAWSGGRPVPPPVTTGLNSVGAPSFLLWSSHGTDGRLTMPTREGLKAGSGLVAARSADRLILRLGLDRATPQLLLVCSAGTGAPGVKAVAEQSAASRRSEGDVIGATDTVALAEVGPPWKQQIVVLGEDSGALSPWKTFLWQPVGAAPEPPGVRGPLAGQELVAHHWYADSRWRQVALAHEEAIGAAFDGDPDLLAFARRFAQALADSGTYQVAVPDVTSSVADVMKGIYRAVTRVHGTDWTSEADDARAQSDLEATRGMLLRVGDYAGVTPMFDAHAAVGEPGGHLRLLKAIIGWRLATATRTLAEILHDYVHNIASRRADVDAGELTEVLAAGALHMYHWVGAKLSPFTGTQAERTQKYGRNWLPPHHRMHSVRVGEKETGGLAVPEGLAAAVRTLGSAKAPPQVPAPWAPRVGAPTWAARHAVLREWAALHPDASLDGLLPAHLAALFLATHAPDHALLHVDLDDPGAGGSDSELAEGLRETVLQTFDTGSHDFSYLLSGDQEFVRLTRTLADTDSDDDDYLDLHADLTRWFTDGAPLLRSSLRRTQAMLGEALVALPRLPEDEAVYVATWAPAEPGAEQPTLPDLLSLPRFQTAYRSAEDALAAMGPAPAAGWHRMVVRVEGSAARDVSFAAGDPTRRQALLPWQADFALDFRKTAFAEDGEPYLSFVAVVPRSETAAVQAPALSQQPMTAASQQSAVPHQPAAATSATAGTAAIAVKAMKGGAPRPERRPGSQQRPGSHRLSLSVPPAAEQRPGSSGLSPSRASATERPTSGGLSPADAAARRPRSGSAQSATTRSRRSSSVRSALEALRLRRGPEPRQEDFAGFLERTLAEMGASAAGVGRQVQVEPEGWLGRAAREHPTVAEADGAALRTALSGLLNGSDGGDAFSDEALKDLFPGALDGTARQVSSRRVTIQVVGIAPPTGSTESTGERAQGGHVTSAPQVFSDSAERTALDPLSLVKVPVHPGVTLSGGLAGDTREHSVTARAGGQEKVSATESRVTADVADHAVTFEVSADKGEENKVRVTVPMKLSWARPRTGAGSHADVALGYPQVRAGAGDRERADAFKSAQRVVEKLRYAFFHGLKGLPDLLKNSEAVGPFATPEEQQRFDQWVAGLRQPQVHEARGMLREPARATFGFTSGRHEVVVALAPPRSAAPGSAALRGEFADRGERSVTYTHTDEASETVRSGHRHSLGGTLGAETGDPLTNLLPSVSLELKGDRFTTEVDEAVINFRTELFDTYHGDFDHYEAPLAYVVSAAGESWRLEGGGVTLWLSSSPSTLASPGDLPAGLDMKEIPDHVDARHELPEDVVAHISIKAVRLLRLGPTAEARTAKELENFLRRRGNVSALVDGDEGVMFTPSAGGPRLYLRGTVNRGRGRYEGPAGDLRLGRGVATGAARRSGRGHGRSASAELTVDGLPGPLETSAAMRLSMDAEHTDEIAVEVAQERSWQPDTVPQRVSYPLTVEARAGETSQGDDWEELKQDSTLPYQVRIVVSGPADTVKHFTEDVASSTVETPWRPARPEDLIRDGIALPAVADVEVMKPVGALRSTAAGMLDEMPKASGWRGKSIRLAAHGLLGEQAEALGEDRGGLPGPMALGLWARRDVRQARFTATTNPRAGTDWLSLESHNDGGPLGGQDAYGHVGLGEFLRDPRITDSDESRTFRVTEVSTTRLPSSDERSKSAEASAKTGYTLEAGNFSAGLTGKARASFTHAHKDSDDSTVQTRTETTFTDRAYRVVFDTTRVLQARADRVWSGPRTGEHGSTGAPHAKVRDVPDAVAVWIPASELASLGVLPDEQVVKLHPEDQDRYHRMHAAQRPSGSVPKPGLLRAPTLPLWQPPTDIGHGIGTPALHPPAALTAVVDALDKAMRDWRAQHPQLAQGAPQQLFADMAQQLEQQVFDRATSGGLPQMLNQALNGGLPLFAQASKQHKGITWEQSVLVKLTLGAGHHDYTLDDYTTTTTYTTSTRTREAVTNTLSAGASADAEPAVSDLGTIGDFVAEQLAGQLPLDPTAAGTVSRAWGPVHEQGDQQTITVEQSGGAHRFVHAVTVEFQVHTWPHRGVRGKVTQALGRSPAEGSTWDSKPRQLTAATDVLRLTVPMEEYHAAAGADPIAEQSVSLREQWSQGATPGFPPDALVLVKPFQAPRLHEYVSGLLLDADPAHAGRPLVSARRAEPLMHQTDAVHLTHAFVLALTPDGHHITLHGRTLSGATVTVDLSDLKVYDTGDTTKVSGTGATFDRTIARGATTEVTDSLAAFPEEPAFPGMLPDAVTEGMASLTVEGARTSRRPGAVTEKTGPGKGGGSTKSARTPGYLVRATVPTAVTPVYRPKVPEASRQQPLTSAADGHVWLYANGPALTAMGVTPPGAGAWQSGAAVRRDLADGNGKWFGWGVLNGTDYARLAGALPHLPAFRHYNQWSRDAANRRTADRRPLPATGAWLVGHGDTVFDEGRLKKFAETVAAKNLTTMTVAACTTAASLAVTAPVLQRAADRTGVTILQFTSGFALVPGGPGGRRTEIHVAEDGQGKPAGYRMFVPGASAPVPAGAGAEPAPAGLSYPDPEFWLGPGPAVRQAAPGDTAGQTLPEAVPGDTAVAPQDPAPEQDAGRGAEQDAEQVPEPGQGQEQDAEQEQELLPEPSPHLAPWYMERGALGAAAVVAVHPWADPAALDLAAGQAASAALRPEDGPALRTGLRDALKDVLATKSKETWQQLLNRGRTLVLDGRLVWLRPVPAALVPAVQPEEGDVEVYGSGYATTTTSLQREHEVEKGVDAAMLSVLSIASSVASAFLPVVPRLTASVANTRSSGWKRTVVVGRKLEAKKQTRFDGGVRVLVFVDGVERGDVPVSPGRLALDVPSDLASADAPRPDAGAALTGGGSRGRRPGTAREVLNAIDLIPVAASLQRRLLGAGLPAPAVLAAVDKVHDLLNEEAVLDRSRPFGDNGIVTEKVSVPAGRNAAGLPRSFEAHFVIRGSIERLQYLGDVTAKVREDSGSTLHITQGRHSTSKAAIGAGFDLTGLHNPEDHSKASSRAPMLTVTLGDGRDTGHRLVEQSGGQTVLKQKGLLSRYLAGQAVTVEIRSTTHTVEPVREEVDSEVAVPRSDAPDFERRLLGAVRTPALRAAGRSDDGPVSAQPHVRALLREAALPLPASAYRRPARLDLPLPAPHPREPLAPATRRGLGFGRLIALPGAELVHDQLRAKLVELDAARTRGRGADWSQADLDLVNWYGRPALETDLAALMYGIDHTVTVGGRDYQLFAQAHVRERIGDEPESYPMTVDVRGLYSAQVSGHRGGKWDTKAGAGASLQRPLGKAVRFQFFSLRGEGNYEQDHGHDLGGTVKSGWRARTRGTSTSTSTRSSTNSRCGRPAAPPSAGGSTGRIPPPRRPGGSRGRATPSPASSSRTSTSRPSRSTGRPSNWPAAPRNSSSGRTTTSSTSASAAPRGSPPPSSPCPNCPGWRPRCTRGRTACPPGGPRTASTGPTPSRTWELPPHSPSTSTPRPAPAG
ncbi:hypothetical protein VSR01_09595 [Actinacidiphila sp. DG2A-62]|uniref:hypothetical protein n=1 Tax=Actinacidiphila sp. DG2A-62 TaxID=3108821 RepID=UPI002DBBB328|nr:hypothetical protein [Actinacidiphila sp. DG2A-62]MEC3993779.1 hypothetical protein [Actinacidiphila sp. DG2A-62]